MKGNLKKETKQDQKGCVATVDKGTNLGEPFLLQVCNDTLTQQIRRADNVQHFFMIVPEKCQLETVLRGVDRDRAGPCGPVKAVDRLALDASEVYGVIQRADHTVVSAYDK